MEKYKRIVFLDIDGVLSSWSFLKTHKAFIDPNNVKTLNKLKEYNVEIVISSSWGHDDGRTEKTLKNCGLELPIIGYTEHFYSDWLCRGNEIEKWIIENCKEIDYEYVIFDDEDDMLLRQKDNFINVNGEYGLTENDIQKAIDILTRKNYHFNDKN